MAKSKYKQYFEEMFAQNRELFLHFKLVHDDFSKDRNSYKEAFDCEGKLVLEIIKDWESRLCGHMEKGSNNVFSGKLADKFWEEIKKYYPLIDYVGIQVRKVNI